MYSSGSEIPLDREEFDDKFSEKRCTAAIFCSGAYIINVCCGAGVFLVPYIHIPHPPSLIMRGGGATGAAENQYGFDKSNKCPAARPGDRFYDFIDAHTHTHTHTQHRKKKRAGGH
jgi:hypothetical protein